MPLVRISLSAGKPADYRRAIGDGIHQAMVETLAVPEHDRFQIFTEHDAGGKREGRVQRLDGHHAPRLIPGVPPALAIATSSFPSPLKSPTTDELGNDPVPYCVCRNCPARAISVPANRYIATARSACLDMNPPR